jgi:hypothetical protein
LNEELENKIEREEISDEDDEDYNNGYDYEEDDYAKAMDYTKNDPEYNDNP